MNILAININGRDFRIDADSPLSIAIPMRFDGAQPNAYGVESATAKACEAGEIVGDTRRGGSVNFEQVKFIPHCNGTHTECVGHITHERISVNDCLQDAFILADLISVLPEKASETRDTYTVELNETDLMITRRSLEKHKLEITDCKSKGLIIRTLPNYENKLTETYLRKIPPFFSIEAMELISELQINHLLVDLPSIDRIFDEGKLVNHRKFWNVEEGSFEVSAKSFINRTITEMIYVSNEIKDKKYLLNLQIAPFQADAAPSRPFLFELS